MSIAQGPSPNSSPLQGPSVNPNRPPPPSLFLGPPSYNASNISLDPISTQTRAPLLRSRSTRAPDTVPTLGRTRTAQPQPDAQAEGDRTDALWAEMQATLAEVEISALSSTHVFGAAHSTALEELREAQIGLAVAWGRGEADEEGEAGSAGIVQQSKAKDGGKETEGAEPEDDGREGDIEEARKRREANERFFKKVGEGVADVVGRLEDVAKAMAKVERESREIWNDGDGLESASVAS